MLCIFVFCLILITMLTALKGKKKLSYAMFVLTFIAASILLKHHIAYTLPISI
ncbi:DUF5993 family protein [Photobacterium iliopiscarium]|uniref:DUF5993 family protein n=1 Tax=Photobacterium iliopiscarium TaxID=56192 RepID=UPI003593A0D0